MAKIKDALNEEQVKKLDGVKKNFTKRNFEHRERPERPARLENGLPYATKFYPQSTVKLALLIKNNAEFRRLISLAIRINLIKKGLCNKEDKVYISYYWNKYAVSINGLKTEQFFTSQEFINAFAVANNCFISYSNSLLDKHMMNQFGQDCLDYPLIEEDTKELNEILSRNLDEKMEEDQDEQNGGE